MCWKNEWARAYRNLQWAIIHIDRAKEKLHTRSINQLKIKLTPEEIASSTKGFYECRNIINRLQSEQLMLKWLIENVGLWVKDDSASTQRLMEGLGETATEITWKIPHRPRSGPGGGKKVNDQTFIEAWNKFPTAKEVSTYLNMNYNTALKYRRRLDLQKKRHV